MWTHFVADLDRPQYDQEGSQACFCCQCPEVQFEAYMLPGAMVHGPATFFPYRRYAGIRLAEDAPAGTRFTFVLQNARMQTYEENLCNFRFTLMEGDTLVGYFGDADYRVVGGPRHHLRVFTPTSVVAGEPFDVKVVVSDVRNNKSGDDVSGLALEVEGLEVGSISYNAELRHFELTGARLESEGVHYATVRLANESVSGESNPMVVKDRWDERIYWGDIHQHTYFADGRGRPEENYGYARATSCLDFCSVTPHQEATFRPASLHIDNPVQEGWKELVEATEKCNSAELVTILGSEAGSLGRIAAHMNSYFLDPDNLPELQRVGLPLKSYADYLGELERSKGEILLLPHAHARGGPGVFDLPLRPDYQTNVELSSVHGVFEAFYQQWLKAGHLVGAHGAGDNHMTSTGNGNPGAHYPNTNGLTGAYAPVKTRRGIWDSLKNRRTYAVTGNKRIYLNLSVNGQDMGSVLPTTAERSVRIETAGTAPIYKIDLLKNNEVVHAYRPELTSRRWLRVLWSDDLCSRRVDDSRTVGKIAVPGGAKLVQGLNLFNWCDDFQEMGGEVVWRACGYSGITRGAIIEVAPETKALSHEIQDVHLGRIALQERIEIPLGERHTQIERVLDLGERFTRPLFEKTPHVPKLTLSVDWIDLDWPKTATSEWVDRSTDDDYYCARIEQVDGELAWSSPVWFRREA
jgi:hypothetical protein